VFHFLKGIVTMEIQQPSSVGQATALFTGLTRKQVEDTIKRIFPYRAFDTNLHSKNTAAAISSTGSFTDFREKEHIEAHRLLQGVITNPWNSIHDIDQGKADPFYYDSGVSDIEDIIQRTIGHPTGSPDAHDPRYTFIENLLKMKMYQKGVDNEHSYDYMTNLFLSQVDKGATYYQTQAMRQNEEMAKQTMGKLQNTPILNHHTILKTTNLTQGMNPPHKHRRREITINPTPTHQNNPQRARLDDLHHRFTQHLHARDAARWEEGTSVRDDSSWGSSSGSSGGGSSGYGGGVSRGRGPASVSTLPSATSRAGATVGSGSSLGRASRVSGSRISDRSGSVSRASSVSGVSSSTGTGGSASTLGPPSTRPLTQEEKNYLRGLLFSWDGHRGYDSNHLFTDEMPPDGVRSAFETRVPPKRDVKPRSVDSAPTPFHTKISEPESKNDEINSNPVPRPADSSYYEDDDTLSSIQSSSVSSYGTAQSTPFHSNTNLLNDFNAESEQKTPEQIRMQGHRPEMEEVQRGVDLARTQRAEYIASSYTENTPDLMAPSTDTPLLNRFDTPEDRKRKSEKLPRPFKIQMATPAPAPTSGTGINPVLTQPTFAEQFQNTAQDISTIPKEPRVGDYSEAQFLAGDYDRDYQKWDDFIYKKPPRKSVRR
jgi:hypothetical protein